MPKQPIGALALGGATALQAPKERQQPEVGSKVLLQWHPWSNMSEVAEGNPQFPGTYIEVEVTAIKTAKLLLE